MKSSKRRSIEEDEGHTHHVRRGEKSRLLYRIKATRITLKEALNRASYMELHIFRNIKKRRKRGPQKNEK